MSTLSNPSKELGKCIAECGEADAEGGELMADWKNLWGRFGFGEYARLYRQRASVSRILADLDELIEIHPGNLQLPDLRRQLYELLHDPKEGMSPHHFDERVRQLKAFATPILERMAANR